jgi:hypothetical protein
MVGGRADSAWRLHKPLSVFSKQRKWAKNVLPRRRWVDNIKMDLGSDGVHWVDLAQNRDQWRAVVNTVMNLRVQ